MWKFHWEMTQNQKRIMVWSDFPLLSLEDVDAVIENWSL